MGGVYYQHDSNVDVTIQSLEYSSILTILSKISDNTQYKNIMDITYCRE